MTWARAAQAYRRGKYGAVRTEFDGIRFASLREAERYRQLRLLSLAGHVSNLQLQVPYVLKAEGGVPVSKYVADFVYRDERTQQTVVEDAKGVKTAVYRLKEKWMKAQYGIEVRCV